MPKLSVITMCHNYGHFLRDCITSVEIQIPRGGWEWEHVIVHAGCVDCRTWMPWSHVLIPDRGLCTSRNIAVALATGEYVCNLDADDKLSRDTLFKVSELCAPDTIVATGLQRFGGYVNEQYPATNIKPSDFLQGNQIYCNSTYPRKAFMQVGGYDEALNVWGQEDHELWIRLSQVCPVIKVIREPLLHYRVHGNSHTTRAMPRYDHLRLAYIRNKHGIK